MEDSVCSSVAYVRSHSKGLGENCLGKIWSLLFLLVPVLGVATFVAGPITGVWFPRDISSDGPAIDHLFMLILWLSAIVFVLTEGLLFWFMWRYDGHTNPDPVKFVHGSHVMEVAWTIVPAIILLFLSFYQMNAWAAAKMDKPTIPPTVEVTGRQFEWRLRYPGADGKLGTADDIHAVNDLHIPVNEEILIDLKTSDVIHSFFLPNLRIKQDAVPGMKIPVWFLAKQTGHYDLLCTELCGWGHYKMKGRLTVESRADFDRWLAATYQNQIATQPGQPGAIVANPPAPAALPAPATTPVPTTPTPSPAPAPAVPTPAAPKTSAARPPALQILVSAAEEGAR